MSSLDEYVTTHAVRRGSPCSVCSLPREVLEQVDSHLLRRTSRRVVNDWLVGEGYGMTTARLHNHVAAGHVTGY